MVLAVAAEATGGFAIKSGNGWGAANIVGGLETYLSGGDVHVTMSLLRGGEDGAQYPHS